MRKPKRGEPAWVGLVVCGAFFLTSCAGGESAGPPPTEAPTTTVAPTTTQVDLNTAAQLVELVAARGSFVGLPEVPHDDYQPGTNDQICDTPDGPEPLVEATHEFFPGSFSRSSSWTLFKPPTSTPQRTRHDRWSPRTSMRSSVDHHGPGPGRQGARLTNLTPRVLSPWCHAYRNARATNG